MRKQELRKYADPGLSFSPGHGLMHTEAIDFILRTAVRNIDGQRVLVVYFYDRQAAVQGDTAPCIIVFQTRQEYTTLVRVHGEGLKWRSSCLLNLIGWSRKEYAFYTQKDRDRVTRFCGLENQSGLEALDSLQSKTMTARLRERIVARERKIIEAMKCVPAKPRDLKGWIHREVLPAYVFYTYRSGRKTITAWCSACRHDVQVEGVRHNAEGHCPRCRRAVTFKSAGKVGGLYDQATAQVIQRTGENEFLLRISKVFKSYRQSYRNPKEDVWENARFFIRWDDSGEISIEPYYYAYRGITTRWHTGERPGMNPWARTFEQDTCGHLYLRNLGGALAGTPWQYSQLQPFYEHDREPMEVLPYLQRYYQHPFIEYLVKLELHKLARHAVYGSLSGSAFNINGRGPREILGVRMEDIPLLQSLDASSDQLGLLRVMREQGLRVEDSLLRWYAEHEIFDKESILRPLRYTTPFKLMQYVECQHERLRDKKIHGVQRYEELRSVLTEYSDYLRIGADLGYDLTNTFVLFPRALHKAHDTASNLYQAKKDEIVEKAIGAAYPSLMKLYGCNRGGFAIIVPKTAKEIVAEGHALRHCVGTYTEHVAKNEQVILFLRRAADLNMPFVTLRLKDGKLVENRGLQNGDPPADAQKFLSRWEREVLQTVPQRMAA